MALKMRMARGGRKKAPFYRIVVADARAPRDGNFIEKVGTYNPLLGKDSKDRIVLDLDLCKKWLAEGAQPSERVAKFLGDAGLIAKPEARKSVEKAKPKAKALQMIKDKEAKAEAAKEAAAQAKADAEAAAAAPAEEAPAEEPVAEAAAEEAPAAEEETKAE